MFLVLLTWYACLVDYWSVRPDLFWRESSAIGSAGEEKWGTGVGREWRGNYSPDIIWENKEKWKTMQVP